MESVVLQHFMTTESGVWYGIPSDRNSPIPFAYTGLLQIKITVDSTEIPNSPILLQVYPRQCLLDFKDDHMLRVPNEKGICVCNSAAIELGNVCFAISNLLLATLLPFGAIVVIVVAALYALHKRKVDAIWSLNGEELKFHVPPVILGRGSFGLVVLGEYRGTSVAVKRVLPQPASGVNKGDSIARSPGGDTSLEHDVSFTDVALADAPGGDPLSQTGSGSGNGTKVTYSSSPINSPPAAASALRFSGRSRIPAGPRWRRLSSFSISRSSFSNSGTSSNAILPMGDLATASDFRKQTERPILGSQVGLRSSNLMSFGRESPLVAFFLGKGYQAKRRVAGLKRDFIEEMRIVSKLRHPSVTTVMGAVLGKEPMLVMEYMTLGSLYDILMNESYPFESDVLLYMLRDVVQGMRFLHTADPPIVHGDLKAANVLITENFKAKVADFGLSQKKRLGNVGTPLWMAPELLNGEVSTAESDVYAFSIMLVEIFSRADPYEGMDPHMVLEAVKDVNRQVVMRPSLPAGLLPEVELMIKDCWHNEPEKRPPFVELDRRVKAFDALQLHSSKILLAGATENKRQAMTQNVLFDVFPQHIAEALVAGRKPQAEKKEVVTIFFSDIVGFTDISSKLEPLKVQNPKSQAFNPKP
jgi:serine/threonine protein kinase